MKRRSRAKTLGLKFNRSAGFTMPAGIIHFGERLPLHVPNDHGSKVAFTEVFLDDCYNLQRLPDAIGAVLDIGAHSGLFSLAARIRWPRAITWAPI